VPAELYSHFSSEHAYIYIWVSKNNKFVYVGQTASSTGTLGRAAQHVAADGVLRRKVNEETGLALEEVRDLKCWSYKLPEHTEFTSTGSSYREAVEYLVQRGILDVRSEIEPSVSPISDVRYSNRANIDLVESCAQEILDEFMSSYE
jgi:hypothetical protein